MKNNIADLEAGDKVNCGCSSGFCHDSIEVIKKTSFKYDENTGENYKVIHLSENRRFDSRNGEALNPPTAYTIWPINKD
jgi:hypothetical protein